jgi:hypothetical protein
MAKTIRPAIAPMLTFAMTWLAFEYDRDGNDLVIRGTLSFFGNPLIRLTLNVIKELMIDDIYVYTNSKGIILKKILGKAISYIVHNNNYQYTTVSINKAFEEILDLDQYQDILFIDPQYPFIDNSLLNELILKHNICDSDLTYILSKNHDLELTPNIFIIKKKLFISIFEKEYNNRKLNIKYIMEQSKSLDYKVNNIITPCFYKVINISSGKKLSLLESCFNDRK